MKMIKKILLVFIPLFFIVGVVKVHADDYSSITLNKLNEIRNNQTLLDTVKSVTITYEDDLSLVDLIAECKNIELLTVNKATINDLTFINDIKPNNNFSLWIEGGYYNMDGLSNDKIISLNINVAFLQNFTNGMNFPNLERLTIESVDGYKDIDYSVYTKLESLFLNGLAINDYQLFFKQLGTLTKLKSLGLSNCNLKDDNTKYLKELNNLKYLDLQECDISDISFLEEMQSIEGFRPPINTKNFDVIKKMPNLKYIYWRGYEQLNLTDDLIQYLDNNNIGHNKYDPTLKQTLLNMINEMNINDNMSIKEKVEKVVDYVHNLNIEPDATYDEKYSDNGLLYIVKFKRGLCHQYSLFENALLKLIGVDSYYINGIFTTEPEWRYLNPDDEFYLSQKYFFPGHAWLMAKDENNIWYGWDPLNINSGEFKLSKKALFWKNPYDDGGISDYSNPLYNNLFNEKYIVTNKTGYEDYLQQLNNNSNTQNPETNSTVVDPGTGNSTVVDPGTGNSTSTDPVIAPVVNLNELKQVGAGKKDVTLEWVKNEEANGYLVQVKSGKKWKTVSTIKKNCTTKTKIKKLKAGKKYTYRVIAYRNVKKKVKKKTKTVKETINITDSVVAITKPNAPKAVIKGSAYDYVKVGYKKVTGGSYYILSRSTSKKGTYTEIASITGTYTDTDVKTGTTYYYKVKACNSNNYCGGWSKVVSKKPSLSKPSTKVSSPEKGKVLITSKTVAGEDGYVIQRSTKKNKGFKDIISLDTTTLEYTQEELKSKKTYYYRTRAYRMIDGKVVYSGWSKVVKVKVK